MNGADVHERSACRHVRNGILAEQKHRAKIDVQYVIEIAVGQIYYRPERHHGSIVDNDVDLSPLTDSRFDCRLDVFDLTHVGSRKDGLAPLLDDLVAGSGSVILVQIDHDYISAFAGK